MTASPEPDPPRGQLDSARSTQRALLLLARGIGYLVYAYVVVVEVILALGFVLLLFGANPSASFVEWVYRSLDRVMDPFRGIFTPIELGATETGQVESIIETSVLFAMIVYAVIAIAVHALLTWLGNRIARLDRQEREDRLERERQERERHDTREYREDPGRP